jgi:hypothetical protein
MDENQKEKEIEKLKQYIVQVQSNLEQAKSILSKLTCDTNSNIPFVNTGNTGFIEGIFNGENMVGQDGKIYPVPANYASKSKLIEGDKLKLTIANDGSFIFKQIGPAERKKIIGILNFEENAFHVVAQGRKYNVLYASVTYFKAKPNDRVTIIVPLSGESSWGALENVIGGMSEETLSPDITIKPTGLTEAQVYGESSTLTDLSSVDSEVDNQTLINNLEI